MNDNLDKWIKDARETTPDSGEYRRLNRILVKERLVARNPSRKRQHRVLIFLVTLLALLIFSGQISQLGSNTFETIKTREVHPLGDTLTYYYDVFGTGSVTLDDSFTESDVLAYKQSLAANDEEIVRVTGLAWGGKYTWLKHVKRDINGRDHISGLAPKNPVSEDPRDLIKFLMTHMEDLVHKTKTLPAQAETTLTIDGVLVKMDVWTFTYPGYGEVTRYSGYPIEK